MFEIFGPLTQPTPSFVPLVIAVWPLVGALVCVGEQKRARARAVAVCAVGVVASLSILGLGTRWPAEERFLLTHLAVAARVGQLDLVLALGLDPLAAFASAVAFLVTGLLIAAQGREALASRRRIALLSIMGCTVQLVVMADGATTLVFGAALSSFVGAVLGHASASCLIFDRIADVALCAAAAVAFWALGGTWIDDQYVSELDARVVSASNKPPAGAEAPRKLDDDDDERPTKAPAARNARASLSLTSLPGAAVLVDGAWLRSSKSLVRSPFVNVPISTGPHTVRVHVGAGSDDFFIPHLTSSEGEHVALAVRGASVTFREVVDDLVTHERPDARTQTGSAFARRRFFGGLSAAGVVLALAFIAFMARARLSPFAVSSPEPARALYAVGTLVIAARYPFGALAPRTATALACVLMLGSLVALARALKGESRGLLAAELGFAGAGVVAGVPAAAVLHGAFAVLWLARSRPPRAHATSAVFFPTRVVIVNSLAALAHGAFPTTLALVATFLGVLVVSRKASRNVTVFTGIATVAAFILAINRNPSEASPVATLLGPSFRVIGKSPSESVSLFLLTFAIVAFAWVFARTPRAEAIARSSVVGVLSELAERLPLGTRSIMSAVASALFELEARFSDALGLLSRAVRGVGRLLFALDDTASSVTARRLPMPSERATRLFLVPVVLATVGLFALPWLS